MDYRPTVIFDFDGVIHSYRSGWKGTLVIPDPPVPGIKEAIEQIRKKYRVVVVSTRCFQKGGIEAIERYLNEHNIVVDEVTAIKPPAKVIIDDRAITFDGNANNLLSKIDNFEHYWTKKPELREVYAVVNDNHGGAGDEVELLFLNKEKAEKYAKVMQEDFSSNNYDVITLYLSKQ